MVDVKVRKVGNSLGIVLPKEVLGNLNLGGGDRVFRTVAPDGSYRMTPYDPEFKKRMQAVKKGMAWYRNTLRALAK